MELVSTFSCEFAILIDISATDYVMLTASVGHLYIFTTLCMTVLVQVIIILVGIVIVSEIMIVNFFLRVLAMGWLLLLPEYLIRLSA